MSTPVDRMEHVQIRLQRADRQYLQGQADRLGLSLSSHLRRILRLHIEATR